MRELILTSKFKKSFATFIKNHPFLKTKIYKTLEIMKLDIFSPILSSHKLSGELMGLRACSCGYDCRIIFSIEKHQDSDIEYIILLDIGTHDEVY
jgi:mRNA-degrading endonuclease YafQ of YafQ-DinJ toxin-antitoxin module